MINKEREEKWTTCSTLAAGNLGRIRQRKRAHRVRWGQGGNWNNQAWECLKMKFCRNEGSGKRLSYLGERKDPGEKKKKG